MADVDTMAFLDDHDVPLVAAETRRRCLLKQALCVRTTTGWFWHTQATVYLVRMFGRLLFLEFRFDCCWSFCIAGDGRRCPSWVAGSGRRCCTGVGARLESSWATMEMAGSCDRRCLLRRSVAVR